MRLVAGSTAGRGHDRLRRAGSGFVAAQDAGAAFCLLVMGIGLYMIPATLHWI